AGGEGRTVVALTFSGPCTEATHSLTDGLYTLTVFGSQVRDAAGGSLDGDGNGTTGGDNLFQTHRLFGDIDGDKDVDLADVYPALANALFSVQGQPGPVYNPALDFDGDGDVDLDDVFQVSQRLFTVYP